MAISICFWANYTDNKPKLNRKSENAVDSDRVLKFLYDCDTNHIESVLTYGEEPSSVVILERRYGHRRLRDDDDDVLYKRL